MSQASITGLNPAKKRRTPDLRQLFLLAKQARSPSKSSTATAVVAPASIPAIVYSHTPMPLLEPAPLKGLKRKTKKEKKKGYGGFQPCEPYKYSNAFINISREVVPGSKE